MGGLGSQLTFDVSQDESSEEFIGEWAEKRGIRDQLVIATKAGPMWHIHSRYANVTLSTRPTSSGAKMKSLTK